MVRSFQVNALNYSSSVTAGLVPAIHDFIFVPLKKSWMPGSRPGMTA
jgi:hypothetical protein